MQLERHKAGVCPAMKMQRLNTNTCAQTFDSSRSHAGLWVWQSVLHTGQGREACQQVGTRAALRTAAGRRGQDTVGCDDGQFPGGSRGCLAPKPKKLVIRPTGPKVKENKRNTGLRFKYRNTAATFQVSSLNDIPCILCGFAYIWTLGFRAPFNTIFCI